MGLFDWLNTLKLDDFRVLQQLYKEFELYAACSSLEVVRSFPVCEIVLDETRTAWKTQEVWKVFPVSADLSFPYKSPSLAPDMEYYV